MEYMADRSSASHTHLKVKGSLQSYSLLSTPLVRFYAGRVPEGAALIMRAIAESGATAAAPMREVALSEGAVLHHLCLGLSSRVQSLAWSATCAVTLMLHKQWLHHEKF